MNFNLTEGNFVSGFDLNFYEFKKLDFLCEVYNLTVHEDPNEVKKRFIKQLFLILGLILLCCCCTCCFCFFFVLPCLTKKKKTKNEVAMTTEG